jgi:hypothetical protein
MMGDLGERRVVVVYELEGMIRPLGTHVIEGPDASGGFYVHVDGRDIDVVPTPQGQYRLKRPEDTSHLAVGC